MPESATLTVRAVPHEEWPTIQGLPYDLSRIDPMFAILVVVEENGVVVGGWMALNTVHLEGLYIAADHRHVAGVAGRLFAGMVDALQRVGTREVLTMTEDPIVRAMALRAGFDLVPGETLKLNVPEAR